jgi:hypothetical protein
MVGDKALEDKALEAKVLKGRLWQSLGIVIVLCLCVMALRPILDVRLRETGLDPAEFMARKYAAGPEHDVVVGGDSRVLRGVAPEEMQAVLGPGVRIANFSYQGTGLTSAYLGRLPGVLDPDGRRCIVLSVTPYSLTRAAQERNDFLEISQKPDAGSQLRLFVDRRLAPLNLPDLLIHWFKPGLINRARSHYYATGWVETDVERPDEDGSSRSYAMLFKDNRVEEVAVGVVLDFVAAAVADGIQVVGLRLPVSPQLLEVENRHAGVDWAQFVRRFRANGGVWLEGFETRSFKTYDGSHLRGGEARRFSRALAAKIGERLGF